MFVSLIFTQCLNQTHRTDTHPRADGIQLFNVYNTNLYIFNSIIKRKCMHT